MKPTLIAISIVLPLLTGAIPAAQAVEMCEGGDSRWLCRSKWCRCCPAPRGSSCRDEQGRHAVGRSIRHHRHGRPRQHRDQSSGARMCFRKRPAGMSLTGVSCRSRIRWFETQ
jgi:hypothetical protein